MADLQYIMVSGPDEDGVVVITLNRPEKKNALSIALRDEFTATLEVLAANEQLKVVVLTGVGNVFCAGFDLTEFADRDNAEHMQKLWDSSDRFHHACLNFPLPLIAAVNGPALAGGFDLAIMCDMRIASETARFAHPERTFAEVIYGPLHDLVGGAIARELCLTGRIVEAPEALVLHLVNAIYSTEKLMEETLALARQIAQPPREILLHNKAKFIRQAAIPPVTTLEL